MNEDFPTIFACIDTEANAQYYYRIEDGFITKVDIIGNSLRRIERVMEYQLDVNMEVQIISEKHFNDILTNVKGQIL